MNNEIGWFGLLLLPNDFKLDYRMQQNDNPFSLLQVVCNCKATS